MKPTTQPSMFELFVPDDSVEIVPPRSRGLPMTGLKKVSLKTPSPLPHEQPIFDIKPSRLVRNRRWIAIMDPMRLPERIWNADGSISSRIRIGGELVWTHGTELILTGEGPRLGIHVSYIDPWWVRLMRKVGLRK